MSEVAMKFVSDARQLLADIEKTTKAEGTLEKQVSDVTKAIGKRKKEQAAMAREAVRLSRETERPMESYKRKLGEIEQLRKKGLITEETHRRAAVKAWNDSGMAAEASRRKQAKFSGAVGKTTGKLKEQSKVAEKAVNTDGIAAMATGWLSVGAAVGVATAAVREYQQAKEAAAQRAIEAQRGMGSLAQVAQDKKEFLWLQDKARELRAANAVDSEAEGAQVMFALKSANALDQFELFKKMGAAKLVSEPAVMGRSAAAIKRAMGEAETGSTRAIISKGFAASQFAPASAENILEAAAKAGVAGKALGYQDEAVLASTAVLSEPFGSASEAGTRMKALFQAIDRRRVALKGEDGKMPETLRETVKKIESMNMEGEDLQKFLGSSEAVQAYRVLKSNMPRYIKAKASIHEAERTDEIGRRLEFHKADPGFVAAKKREQAEAAVEHSTRDLGTARNLSEAYLLSEAAYERGAGYNEAAVWTRDKARRLRRAVAMPTGAGQDVNFLQSERSTTGLGITSEHNPRAEEYYKATRKLSDAADKLDAVVDKQLQVVDKQAEVVEQQASPANPAVSHGDHR